MRLNNANCLKAGAKMLLDAVEAEDLILKLQLALAVCRAHTTTSALATSDNTMQGPACMCVAGLDMTQGLQFWRVFIWSSGFVSETCTRSLSQMRAHAGQCHTLWM